MELTKKEENRCYKLAQEIDAYDEDKNGCIWGHIYEGVVKTYKEGFKAGKKSAKSGKENKEVKK